MRRRIALLMVCLVLGVMLNVAIAWPCSVFIYGTIRRHTVPVWNPVNFWGPTFRVREHLEFTLGADEHGGEERYSFIIVETGLPLTTMAFDHVLWRFGVDNGESQFRHAVTMRTRVADYYALPLRPIWPGFAINTVIYAAITLFLVRCFTGARQLRRFRRGRCPLCKRPAVRLPSRLWRMWLAARASG